MKDPLMATLYSYMHDNPDEIMSVNSNKISNHATGNSARGEIIKGSNMSCTLKHLREAVESEAFFASGVWGNEQNVHFMVNEYLENVFHESIDMDELTEYLKFFSAVKFSSGDGYDILLNIGLRSNYTCEAIEGLTYVPDDF